MVLEQPQNQEQLIPVNPMTPKLDHHLALQRSLGDVSELMRIHRF
jgi:hypothetical protein